MRIIHLIAAAILLALFCQASLAADWQVIGARWRPDRNDFASRQLWEGTHWHEGWGQFDQFYPEHFAPSGSVHAVLRNTSNQPQTITLAEVNGQKITDALTTLTKAGPVIWYDLDSPQLPMDCSGGREDVKKQAVPPGQWVQCDVRLRTVPTEPVRLKFAVEKADGIDITVPVKQPAARLESVAFSPRIDRLYCYVRSMDAAALRTGTLTLDGKPVSRARWTPGPADSGTTLVEAPLDPAWSMGSYHLIEIDLKDGSKLVQPTRAWDCFFSIGQIGASSRYLVLKAKERGFNTYYWTDPVMPFAFGMNQVPSANWGEYPGRTLDRPGVLFNYNWDEPDCHDWSWGDKLPPFERLGVLAEQIVLPILKTCLRNAPTVPNLILSDGTYKPLNWYTYGQLADVFGTDPYVLLGGDQVDYVGTVMEIARDASTPRPLICILWANGFEFAEGAPRRMEGGDANYRAPSPAEERMMAFYALGAGSKGLAYFCDFPDDRNMIEKTNGRWLHLSMNQPLFDEVGRINRDTLTIAPYLSIGCPLPHEPCDERIYASRLMCGPDRMVLILVNKDHYIAYNTFREFEFHNPTKNVEMSVGLPKGFGACTVQEVKGGALVPVKASATRDRLKLKLDAVDTARAFVITRQSGR